MAVYPIVLAQQNFTHQDSLHYPFEERGLQFGDGIYEVIRIYKGNYYLLKDIWIVYFVRQKPLKLI